MAEDNSKKKENPPFTHMTLLENKSWSNGELTITITVVVEADKSANRLNRPVRFYKPGDMSTLHRTTSGTRGRTSHSFVLSRDEVARLAKGKIKYGVELEAQIDVRGTATQKTVRQEIEVDVKYPAGTIRDGFRTLWMRKEKHIKDLLFALSITAILIWVTENGQRLGFVLSFTVAVLLSCFFWWKKNKSKMRTFFCFSFLAATAMANINSPMQFTQPLIDGIKLALWSGIPFYILEEVWRKNDGSSVKNFYPVFPIAIGIVWILWDVLSMFGVFLPQKSGADSQNALAYLNVNNNWTFLNEIPGLGTINFSRLGDKFKEIISLVIAVIILTIYGGGSDFIEWAKTWSEKKDEEKKKIKREDLKESPMGSSAKSIVESMFYFSEGIDFLKTYIIPFFRKKK